MNKLRNAIEVAAQNSHASPSRASGDPAGTAETPANSTADDLQELADLHQKGLLTGEQFEAAKSKLLG
jgi:hypothetical protein